MADNRKHKHRKKNSVKPLAVLAVVILLCIVAVGVALASSNESKKVAVTTTTTQTKPSEEDWGNRLVYKGQKYRRNPNLHTILFVGVDQESDTQWEDFEAVEGTIGNVGRADTNILFIMNDETKETEMLLISRDTMTDVDVYDTKGKFAYTTKNHLNMQYSYGDSPSKSLFLMKRTVGNLLYNIRIDGALSLTMDGIVRIVDLLGGIPITMNQDYSYIDPRFTEGTKITLDGEEMEHFIRYRDTDSFASNEKRIERQSWLVGEVFQHLKNTGAMTFIEELIDKDPEYLEADVDADLLKKLSKYNISSTRYKVPGENVQGEMYDEFYVDEEALQDLIVELLYVPDEEETKEQLS